MPSRRNTSAASQPAIVTPTETPLRQTRARSKLNNAPRLMTGLDHRGRAVDPLSTDPENIIFDHVVRKLRRKKKIIFRHRSETPESPTDNVKAAKRAQLKKKVPAVSSASVASSSHSRSTSSSSSDPDSDGGVPLHPQPSSSSSSDSGSDGGVPLTSRSPSESSSDPDSDGGVPLNSPSQSSSSGFESGYATYGSSASALSRGSLLPSGSSHHSGASHHSDHSGSGPSGAGASAPLGDDDLGWASQSRPSPPIRGTPNQPEPGERLPPRVPCPTPASDASEDTPMEDGIESIKSLPLLPSNAVQGFEFRDRFSSRFSEPPTRKSSPEDVRFTTVDKTGSTVAVAGDFNPPTLSDDDEDQPPRAATRRTRASCAGDSLRKRRRSKDDGSAPQAAKKPRVEEPISFSRTFSLPYDDQSDIVPQMLNRVEEEEEEEDIFYSPTYDIPVTEQSDINLIPSPVLTTTKIPGLAFLETQNVSITTDNTSPKALTPIEAPADFDSEIPGLYGSGKRPRLHYDWYEQYHRLGPDCEKVHGCQHGQFCHQCHADWHKAWSHFFKRQDEVDDEVAATTNYDIRKGYLGTALGFEHSPKPVIEPIPPRGGKIRTHPARIAKEKLALMKKMAESG
ncbi:Hypothetical protein NCS54_00236300 [Fusarium falciforme]|uniref:Hypothetical protein n=1 Tax=Fusarium falciforme TaxID=195108 RepID=UPI0023018C01|nr:Hypothetical protein NCS54_00236300 [Fusarium falciforme]WAO85128.1 Hypothetical protein NCS54_00236300 [Fusarium falciforme]